MHMDAYAKQYLGWLDLKTVNAGDKATFRLGPAERDMANAYQAVAINLPAYQRTDKPFPTDGADQDYLYSGKGDNLDYTAVRTLDAPLTADTPVSLRADYDIEEGWDYAYLDAKVGDSWKHVTTHVSAPDSPNGQNFGSGITGSSNGWKDVTGTLPAGTTAYRLRYWTDGAAGGEGIAVGDVKFGSTDDTMSDTSAFDLAFLGQIGAVPGWPGADTMPPQPMHQQIQAVLDRYAANGGEVRVVTLESCAHGVPLEDPQAVADAITAHL